MSNEIERLKAEMHEANRVASEANDKAREAARAYKDALYAATGLSGHLVEVERKTWKKTETLRFVVDRLGRWSNTAVAGRVVKKDGSTGERLIEANVADLKDLGLYEAPQP